MRSAQATFIDISIYDYIWLIQHHKSFEDLRIFSILSSYKVENERKREKKNILVGWTKFFFSSFLSNGERVSGKHS